MFFEQMHQTWQDALASERPRLDALEQECVKFGQRLAPPIQVVMRAFETPMDEVRVLLLGQDPYPTPGHAVGLAFAVSASTNPLPRSLQNIMKELASDYPALTNRADLDRWQAQGVMLLNRHLSTLVGETGSHLHLGWSKFTDAAIRALANAKGKKLVAILWGKHAQSAAELLAPCNLIESAHPSPLSAHRGFFGSKPFSRCNDMLTSVGLEPIDWSC
jgi:uracil-DNA glycosylase